MLCLTVYRLFALSIIREVNKSGDVFTSFIPCTYRPVSFFDVLPQCKRKCVQFQYVFHNRCKNYMACIYNIRHRVYISHSRYIILKVWSNICKISSKNHWSAYIGLALYLQTKAKKLKWASACMSFELEYKYKPIQYNHWVQWTWRPGHGLNSRIQQRRKVSVHKDITYTWYRPSAKSKLIQDSEIPENQKCFRGKYPIRAIK